MRRLIAAFFVASLSASHAPADDLKSVTVAVLKFGTVNWEMDTIKRTGLDEKNGFSLEVLGLAGGSASKIAFQGGAADAMVSDWIWVARQRAAGRDFIFVPYSKAIGGIAVAGDGPIKTLGDLKGKTIGIAGGPLDKSWLILQAYAQQEFDFDLAEKTEQVFGAPPLIAQKVRDGEIDAAINYWHFLAKLRAGGFRIIAPVSEAAKTLGLDADTPMLGYVFKGDFARENPEIMSGFVAASRGAKDILSENDDAWEAVRPKMRVKTDAQFEELKIGFRAGVPMDFSVKPNSAKAMFALMAELGGEALVGEATELPDGVFYSRP